MLTHAAKLLSVLLIWPLALGRAPICTAFVEHSTGPNACLSDLTEPADGCCGHCDMKCCDHDSDRPPQPAPLPPEPRSTIATPNWLTLAARAAFAFELPAPLSSTGYDWTICSVDSGGFSKPYLTAGMQSGLSVWLN